MKTLLRHLAAILLIGTVQSFVPTARAAAPASPVGGWDFVMSGRQLGNAVITFSNNYTLGGTEVFRVPPRKPYSSKSNPRGSGDDLGRGGVPSTPSTNSTATTTNAYGSADIDGAWTIDAKGRILGYFREISLSPESDPSGTNIVYQTNGVSFRAVLNKTVTRMTLQAYTRNGLSTFRGLQAVDLPDLDGDFYGMGTKYNQPFVDFFTFFEDPLALNVYYFSSGQNSTSDLRGKAIVSRHKQIALVTLTLSETPVLSVYVGPFKTNSLTGKLKGSDGTLHHIPYTIGPRF